MSGYKPPSGAGGTADHAVLSNLDYASSGHTGSNEVLFGTNSAGEASEYDPTQLRAWATVLEATDKMQAIQNLTLAENQAIIATSEDTFEAVNLQKYKKTDSSATKQILTGSVLDLCSLTDDSDLLSGSDPGTTWTGTNLTSAGRASNVITVVHSNVTADGSNARETNAQPSIIFDNTPLCGRLIVKAALNTNANYQTLNLFMYAGGGAPYYGLQVYNGTLEAWHPTTVRATASATTTNANWYMLEWAYNSIKLAYSTSSTEPTEYGSSASNAWKFLDSFRISEPAGGSNIKVGVGFWNYLTNGCTYTIDALRLESK